MSQTDKEHFNLYEYPNPLHTLKLGRLLVTAQFAKGYWSYVINGSEYKTSFAFFRIRNKNGTTIRTIIIFKLMLCIGWIS